MHKHHLYFVFFWAFIGSFINSYAQKPTKNPSFEEVIARASASSYLRISPNGKDIAFQVRKTDWKKNRFDTEIWLSKNGGTPFQLTNSLKGNSTTPVWSPDGQWIAFVSNRNKRNQAYVINAQGGEAFPVTNEKTGVYSLKWSPDGQKISFLTTQKKSKDIKAQEKKYGKFALEDKVYRQAQLRYVVFNPDKLGEIPMPCPEPKKGEKSDCPKQFESKELVKSKEFTVRGYFWSPDGSKVLFNHQPNPLINSFLKSDISVLDISTKKITSVVKNPSYDGAIDWSPDGKSILYSSDLDNNTSNFYTNSKVFIMDLASKKSRQIGTNVDENINSLIWNKVGIFGIAYQKTNRYVYKINPKSGKANKIDLPFDRVIGISVNTNGQSLALLAENNGKLSEVYWIATKQSKPRKLTNFAASIQDWKVSKPEVIDWKSKDGATIEGILHKPMDYDPKKKYPLLIVIHGGPTGISLPRPTPAYVYPILQWLNKGALVLQPNYRGSAGYGEKFRALNVKNLGVGDAWDVISGADFLINKGLVDANKIGVMGWSQGGYISAYLTTTSQKFKAVSVGAGISNWMTYYVNTDIHPFTRQYLKATPWQDKKIYEKTSPMTFIKQAKTPTLIQHGEFDRRVPIANAYELYQGLQDVGVESRLIVYKGFGHGISKPKERLAAMWHNWQWFGKYLWGEDIEIPNK